MAEGQQPGGAGGAPEEHGASDPLAGDLRSYLQRSLGAGYTLERELGGGGMSRVFVARDHALGRKVVVKVLPPELAAALSVERFRREVMLAAALQHPNIVPVLSTGTTDRLPYFVMPFVEGESLRVRLGRGPLSVREAVSVMKDVARALAYAHGRGVIHRDIKPDNIIISGATATVTDFGVAKAVAASRAGPVRGTTEVRTPGGSTITHAGVSLGTPMYMAPEQAAADPNTDHRADLYALGIVSYEMLVGAPPFHGRSPQALLAAQLTELPRPISQRRYGVPAALEQLIMQCLEKNPADRPRNAGDMVRALDDPELLSGAPAVPPQAAATRRRRSVGRWLSAGVAVTVLGLTAAYVAGVFAGGEPSTAEAGALAPASIAVLPIADASPGNVGRELADGFTEALTNALGRVPGLRVASRTAAAAAHRQPGGVQEIGRALGVGKLVEGTVQRQGDSARMTVRLLDVRDGFTEWSQTYDRPVAGGLAAQDEIATEVASAIAWRMALPAPPGSPRRDSTGTPVPRGP
ncbi:MAG: protein kinase [Gemmatimonadaceae bacterium]